MRHLFLLFFLSVIFPAFGQVPPRPAVERDTAALQKGQFDREFRGVGLLMRVKQNRLQEFLRKTRQSCDEKARR